MIVMNIGDSVRPWMSFERLYRKGFRGAMAPFPESCSKFVSAFFLSDGQTNRVAGDSGEWE
jgi:hypothetical protein